MLSKRVFKKKEKKPSEYLVDEDEIEGDAVRPEEFEGESVLGTILKTSEEPTGLHLDWDAIKKTTEFKKAIIEVLADLKCLRMKGTKTIAVGPDAIKDLERKEFATDLKEKAKSLKREAAPTAFELEMERLGEE